MMRDRYSCRKSIWRWLIMVVPPPAGAGGAISGCLIYHTSITPGNPCSTGPVAAGRRRGSADNARHGRVPRGRSRLAGTNDLAALDHVQPAREIRQAMDVRLGDERRMPVGRAVGRALN